MSRSFASRVIAWQRRHGRHDLPWQQPRDAYRVWLSEVMLQQTQVATVRGYFERFVARFPDVHALAAASPDEVLALWSGLGYYSRARNLHRCAQQVVAEHGGRFPRAAAQLQTLPGIGRSTAAAIAALAHGERAAILDGNVKRVLARWLAFGDDLARPAAIEHLWTEAEALLPARGIATYTQGLMDLGAGVCAVREPRCGDCPVAGDCRARREGRPRRYPVKSRRVRRHARSDSLLWLTWGERVWLVRRPPEGIWAGLWSLPEAANADHWLALAAQGGWPGRAERLPPFVHVLTHRDWTLEPLRWRLPVRVAAARRGSIEASLPGGRWVAAADALALGLPAPVRRLLEQAGSG